MIKEHIYDAAHSGDVKEVSAWLTAHPEKLDAEISDGFTLLHVASAFGQVQLVSYLLDRNAKVNVNATNLTRATPLHLATLYINDETAARIVDRLIANGAELNAPQNGGQTALHHAVARGSKPVVETLIHAGADPMLKDNQGRCAMDLSTGDSAMPRYAPKCTRVLEVRCARDLETAARLLLALR